MADIKISELTAVSSLNNGDLVEVSQVNALAPSGYTSLKATMADLGSKVNRDIDYTTDLADFENKTTLGAIKETAKGKNIADEYDATQTYNKGDVVIYKNTLYICTTNNTTGAWDATKWTATTVQSLIGDLSQLTTSDKSSLVGAVNEVNGKFSGYAIKEYTDTMPTSISNKVVQVDSGVDFAYLIGASVYNSGSTRYECLQIGTEMAAPDFVHINMLKNSNGTLSLRLFIDGATGLSVFNGATVKAICLVKYS